MRFRRSLWALIAIFLVIQLLPANRSNPPVESEIPAPPRVKNILQRACYDCHSNETRWPWYSAIAPMSWLVIYDVDEAREHMNFSTWNQYDDDERRDHLEEASEEVEDGNMPLWYYLPLHPDARLASEARETLHSWIRTQTED